MVKLPKFKKPVFKLPVHYDRTHYTLRKFVRDQYVEEQGGLCCHCGELLTEDSGELGKSVDEHQFPKGFFTHTVHLRHDHDSGLTIGAVHAHCNAVLWHYFGE